MRVISIASHLVCFLFTMAVHCACVILLRSIDSVRLIVKLLCLLQYFVEWQTLYSFFCKGVVPLLTIRSGS